jgi:HSP20 family protein
MSSFFEKLRNGMGMQEPLEETVEEKKPAKEKPAKQKKPRTKKIKTEERKQEATNDSEEQEAPTERQIKRTETKTICVEKTEEIEEPAKKEEAEEEKPEPIIEKSKEKKWFGQEGQLAIDVFQTDNQLIIQSAIAGIKSEDLDISIEKDIISIRGVREKQSDESGDYFIQECFWGPFSREIIVPVEIDPNLAEALMKDGVLTIKLPKIVREKKRKIVIK